MSSERYSVSPTLTIGLALASVSCIYPVRELNFTDGGQLQFYAYDDPALLDSYQVLPDAVVWVRDETGATLNVAQTDGSGLWTIDVDPGTVVDIGIWAEGRVPTVRRATGPSTVAIVAVAMYPRAPDLIPVLMDQLAALDGLDLPDSTALLQGEAGALVIEPADPEAWIGAEMRVSDGMGATAPLVSLTVVEGGYAIADNSPVDIILAPQLAEGQVEFSVVDRSGRSTTQTWTLAAGELIDGQDFSLAGAQ